MGLFRISRKLQFRVCNHCKPHASSPNSKGMRMLMQRGKGSWEGCSNRESIAFHWLSPCQQRSFSSSCGSATFARYERTLFDLPTLFNWGLSSVHGILQARILEWVAIPSFRISSWPRDWTHISCIAGRFFTPELPGKTMMILKEVISSLLNLQIQCNTRNIYNQLNYTVRQVTLQLIRKNQTCNNSQENNEKGKSQED